MYAFFVKINEKLFALLHRRIEALNQKMHIPSHIAEIQEKDIPSLAKHASKEANPLYPVPVLWNAKELAPLYRQIKGE